jgi:trigger factor
MTDPQPETTATDGVAVTVTEAPAWKRVLAITIPESHVLREQARIVESFRKNLRLPGFRKGKVPKEIASKYLGDGLGQDLIERLLPKTLAKAIQDQELKVIGDPRVRDLKYEPGEPLTFVAEVEVVPQLEITGYKGLKVTRENPDVDEEAINRTLDALRERRAELEEVERPAAPGDVLDIAYIELGADDQPAEEEPSEDMVELGNRRTPEAFNEHLAGTVAGDTKVVPITYPVDYVDAELAGRTRRFQVTVKAVKEKIWPALDDAFAKAVMETEDATADKLKEQVRLNHEAEAQMQGRRQLGDRLLNRIVELNPFDLPQGIIQKTLERILADAKERDPNMSDEDRHKVMDAYRPMVEGRYRTDLVLETIARQEGIEVTEEDLDRQIDEFAKSEDKPPAKIKAELKKTGGLNRLRDELFQRRMMDALIELADVAEAEKPGASEEEKA